MESYHLHQYLYQQIMTISYEDFSLLDEVNIKKLQIEKNSFILIKLLRILYHDKRTISGSY